MRQQKPHLVPSADRRSWSTDLRCELTSVKLSADGTRILISCNPDVSSSAHMTSQI